MKGVKNALFLELLERFERCKNYVYPRSLDHWTSTWIQHTVGDALPVWRQTYGYLPSHTARWPVLISCLVEGRRPRWP